MTDSSVVTTVVRRRIRPGRIADYERWLHRLQTDAGSLDGYLGATSHPPSGADDRTYTTIFRFSSLAERDAFQRSDLNRRALAEVQDLVEGDPLWDTYTGLELWFTPPPGTVAPRPIRWRMALVLGVVVYLLVLVFGAVAELLIGDVLTALRLAVVIAVEIALMTYLILPFLTRRLASWIFPRQVQS